MPVISSIGREFLNGELVKHWKMKLSDKKAEKNDRQEETKQNQVPDSFYTLNDKS